MPLLAITLGQFGLGWLILASILFGVVALIAAKRGPDEALAASVFLPLVVPVWVRMSFGGLEANVHVATAMWGLLIYCLHPRASLRVRLTPVDYAGICLVATNLISDSLNQGFGAEILFRAYGEWFVPYACGRLIGRNGKHFRQYVSIACGVAVVLALLAIVESALRVNLWNDLVGARPEDRTPSTMLRFGLKRAEGPTTHAIWFGMIQAILFGYALTAAEQAFRGARSRWWLAMPLISGAGVLFSVSRGPVICAALSLAVYLLFAFRVRWPYVVGIFAMLGLIALVANRQVIAVAKSGDNAKYNNSKVELGGGKLDYNSVNYRFLILRAYATAVRCTGLFGYGTDRMSTFPPQVPYDADARIIHKRIWSIDNEYLLILLRFGFLGLASFASVVALATFSALRYGRLDSDPSTDRGPFARALVSILAGVALILSVEWMPSDWGFAAIFTLGISSSLWLASPDRAESSRPKPSYRPGSEHRPERSFRRV